MLIHSQPARCFHAHSIGVCKKTKTRVRLAIFHYTKKGNFVRIKFSSVLILFTLMCTACAQAQSFGINRNNPGQWTLLAGSTAKNTMVLVENGLKDYPFDLFWSVGRSHDGSHTWTLVLMGAGFEPKKNPFGKKNIFITFYPSIPFSFNKTSTALSGTLAIAATLADFFKIKSVSVTGYLNINGEFAGTRNDFEKLYWLTTAWPVGIVLRTSKLSRWDIRAEFDPKNKKIAGGVNFILKN